MTSYDLWKTEGDANLMVRVNCENCGREIYAGDSIEEDGLDFCSHDCVKEYLQGMELDSDLV